MFCCEDNWEKHIPRLKYPISFSQNQPSLLSPLVPVAGKYIDTVTATQDCWFIFTILLWFSSSRMFNMHARKRYISETKPTFLYFLKSCGKSVLVIICKTTQLKLIIVTSDPRGSVHSVYPLVFFFFAQRSWKTRQKPLNKRKHTVSFMFSCLDSRILW